MFYAMCKNKQDGITVGESYEVTSHVIGSKDIDYLIESNDINERKSYSRENFIIIDSNDKEEEYHNILPGSSYDTKACTLVLQEVLKCYNEVRNKYSCLLKTHEIVKDYINKYKSKSDDSEYKFGQPGFCLVGEADPDIDIHEYISKIVTTASSNKMCQLPSRW